MTTKLKNPAYPAPPNPWDLAGFGGVGQAFSPGQAFFFCQGSFFTNFYVIDLQEDEENN